MATGFCFLLFGLGGVVLPALALPALWSLGGGEQARTRRTRLLVQKTFALFVYTMKLLGILTWRVTNRDQLRQPGQLILANHPTLLDVVFLVSLIPNACCIVGGRLRANPAMRGFITLAGYITNDVGESLLTESASALAQGSSLVVFPEGTRSKPGYPLHFLRGAANVAVRAGSAITPVLITCVPISLTKGSPWYEIPDSPMRFHIIVGSKISIDSYLHEAPSLAVRKLTRDLQSHFTEELVKHDSK